VNPKPQQKSQPSASKAKLTGPSPAQGKKPAQRPSRGQRTDPIRRERTSNDAGAGALSAASAAAVQRLLSWYAEHQRVLPWRAARDPYAIWVSEIMLQQTQVQTVQPYFQRWLAAFPTLQALAAASESEVLQIWQGLGYYSRARSLQRGARQVVENGGQIPSEVHALRALPGVGPYTAGAIASIAFGKDEPTVDGNIARVLSRWFALDGNLQKEPQKSRLWQLAGALLPQGRAGDFNQALMELGALICTPKKPLCLQCPVRAQCAAFKQGEPTRYPEPVTRPSLTEVHTVAALAKRRGKVLLAELAPGAPRWGGLWVFPFVELGNGETGEAAATRALLTFAGLQCAQVQRVTELTHHITRYKIQLALYACSAPAGSLQLREACAGARWIALSALGDLPMPAPHRKLAGYLASAESG
jgi:A/G-specific adenine glycosylase